ncbi:replicative DNA helicase [Nocardia farcinica]|uniref:Replicative DNA helicase n=1 Tax=Nocardia farcinica TaxID=37329 RepID=A0A0H5P0Y5_NOCFR|nr:replicative DNA helicase [Nocardia farcinica]AXK87202.1 intein-containing replicative DNA helicase [Nocardia farcinica]MBA4857003.1 replicative DNA helicase [Nocardia farcinica]MBC9815462.1 replicative DNA helicase [Nocardia farcinica]MBF6069092.1 replicative DNA helicase [Nocardia farcinica]MBF6142727.1 replicative DNA helicase [Nocardia farcinica]
MTTTDDRGHTDFPPEPPGEDFGRQPPHDMAAEQSVLGGMLLSKDAIADVVEVIRPGDFYRPAHQAIYDTILDLYGRGEPADPVTVAAGLDRRGELKRIGGAPYLVTLTQTVPTAANAGYYAEIVAEKAILRRLVEAGTRIVQYGYAGADGQDIAEVVDRAQAEVYEVTERRTTEDFLPLEELLQPTMDEIDSIASRGGISLGVPTGFSELDELTNGLHPGQMIIVAARPGVGKSTLGMDFMRSCSIKHGLASVIFSLEMSRTEIVMRLLSAEAKIKLADMRSGRMSDDDWTKLARRMSEISEAPLFVDDSPNLTMMEIRAKARRLKQRHDLKLVVVDYLQLMTSGKKVESRQQEVSDFSRNLKLLAKELEVPVVAISQLNRGPEQRTDKRPMVSDLRESGCLPASTRILRADTGAESTLGELLASGEQPLVWSLDERMRMVARPMVKVFPSGRKEVFRLRLASGREVEATGNHPFLTVDGWIPLDRLTVGDRLATPRSVPEPVHTERMADAEVVLLAHMIGDGSCVRRQPVRYASIDEQNLAAVSEAAEHFGVTAVRDDYAAARVTTLRLPAPYRLSRGKRNPIAAWLDELGLFGLRSHEKFIPRRVFALPNDQVALFLRHLWATDGSVRWDSTYRQARVYYTSTSRRLIDDVAQLLLRLGVHGRIRRVTKPGYRDAWHLTIDGADNQTVFLRDVGVHGARGDAAQVALAELEPLVRNTNVDTVPKEVWNQVRHLLATKNITHREFSAAMGSRFCGSTMWKRSPSRSRLARVAAVLDDADIEMYATNDVFWDKIVEITSLGEQDVYDGTVPGTHNFVAQSISVHNSLEQDADMVILLHRPDAFERDDPRGGEADLIVGKHRNGPTATITVAHQLHLSRFVDMARG